MGRQSSEDDASYEFKGPGFRFVRFFLLSILLILVGIGALVIILSWHLGMDVTVQGKGSIEPRVRHQVKASISGMISGIHVRQGQKVAEGDTLVTLDDTELRAELEKVNKEVEVNQSRRVEIENRIKREQRLLEAKVEGARMELESAALRMERVRREHVLYDSLYPPSAGGERESLDSRLPIRLQMAMLQVSEANLEGTRRRLNAVEGRRQEIETLTRIWEKLEQDRAMLRHRLERTEIRAPASGTVLTGDLPRRVGDHVLAGEAILELGQLNLWQAKVLVREPDIPKIEVGQEAKLFVNAFPHVEYKIFRGRVDAVPSEPIVGTTTEGALYPVKVSIQDPVVSNGDRVYNLAYGMAAEARIVVERGLVIDLLWRKLLRTAGKIGKHPFYTRDVAERITFRNRNGSDYPDH